MPAFSIDGCLKKPKRARPNSSQGEDNQPGIDIRGGFCFVRLDDTHFYAAVRTREEKTKLIYALKDIVSSWR